jgi:hypothetical protein
MRLSPRIAVKLAREVNIVNRIRSADSHRAFVEAQIAYEDGRDSDDYD